MKLKSYLLIFISFVTYFTYAQVGIGTINPEPSSILDVESTTKGFLLPRVSEHTVVSNPAIGLMIYDLTDHCINVFIGNDTWKNLCETGSGGGGTGIITVPPTDQLGEVNISTKICFDVAETNDAADGCGALQMRTPIEADFTDAGTHTQTLTISSTSAIDNIVVSALDLSGKVILNANPPLVNSLLANESTTATIEYKQDLNTEATGLDHANRLTATIYVNYDEAGVAKQVQISPFVKDCACSNINSTTGEHHLLIDQTGDAYALATGNSGAQSGYTIMANVTDNFGKLTVPGGTKITKGVYGDNAAIMLGENGVPYVFGYAGNKIFGQATNAFSTISAVTTLNSISTNNINEAVIDISVGHNQSAFLTESLKIYTAGQSYGTAQHFPANFTGYNTGFPLTEVSLPSGAGDPVALYSAWESLWVIDEHGDLYATGRNNFSMFGLNLDNFDQGASASGQKTFKKLQLADSGISTFNMGIGTGSDFPSRVIDVSATYGASSILLEDGDIYFAGYNNSQTTPGNMTTINPINAVWNTNNITTVFSKLVFDGDAVSMGQPVDIELQSNAESTSGSGTHTPRVVIFVLDDRGDVYVKGSVNHASYSHIKFGGWGNSVSQDTFKKIVLPLNTGEVITSVKTNYNYTMLITSSGRIFYAGQDDYSTMTQTETPTWSPVSTDVFIAPVNPDITSKVWRE